MKEIRRKWKQLVTMAEAGWGGRLPGRHYRGGSLELVGVKSVQYLTKE